MKVTRRIIWVPYGYRIKPRYRKPSQQKKTVNLSKKQCDTTMITPKDNATLSPASEQHEVASIPTQSSAPVSHFAADFNPYQNYIADMARCMNALPKESFISQPDKANQTTLPTDKNAQKRAISHQLNEALPRHQTEKNYTAPLPESISPQTSKAETLTIDHARLNNIKRQSVYSLYYQNSGQINPDTDYHYTWQFIPLKTVSKEAEDTQISSIHPPPKKTKAVTNNTPKQLSPNLRRLTGVRPCLRAKSS